MTNLSYLVLAALAVPALADPNAQQQYETLQQAYYHFDPKAYQSFTCHVDVSTLDELVAGLRQSAAAHPGMFQVNEQLVDYTLTIDHTKGISITDPTFDVVILNEKAAADPERLKKGVDETKHGFDAAVQGVDKMINGLYGGYLPEHRDVDSVTRDGNKWIVKITKGGATDTETIDGSHVHDEAGANGVSVVSDSDYAPVSGDKLGLQAANIKISQGAQNITSTMTATYQKLGVLQVPASLVTKTTSGMAGVTQTADITINFQNCNIKN